MAASTLEAGAGASVAGPSQRSTSPLDTESMTPAERKKRTRPVSACENCRSKKVKCNLLPDRPVCINCEQSGKQCLFRVDDLSPALRRERFSEYGEPAKVDTPPQSYRRRKSRRKSSLVSSARDEESAGRDGRENSDEGMYADGTGENRSAAKAKAVFRCFANPTKLAAPSAPNALSAGTGNGFSTPSDISTNDRSATYFADAPNNTPQSWTYPWGTQDQARSVGEASTPASGARHSRRNTVDSYWMAQQGISTPFGAASEGFGSAQQLDGHQFAGMINADSQVPAISRPSQHRSYSDAAVLGSVNMPPPSARNNAAKSIYENVRDESATSRYWAGQGTPGQFALPSPSLRSETHDNHGSVSAQPMSGQAASNAHFSPHERISGRDSVGSASSRPPATFKKIALPFFRWFGATANTPGIRRIKVGVYHDAEGDLGRGEADDAADAGDAHSPGLIAHDYARNANSNSSGPHSWPATLTSNTNEVMSTPRSDATPSHSHGIEQQAQTQGHAPEASLSASSRELFEADRPRYPRRDILVHLTGLFLKCFKASCFPWLDSAELMANADNGELPAIVANAICALTARFSNRPDLKSVKNATEAFSDMAKILIVPMLSWPSIDVIEALILLSYVEFAAGADAGLWMYIGMALRMATDLGLQHELTVQSMATPRHTDRARYIFWSIVSLDRITCFGTGRPVTMRDDAYDCQLPPLSDDVHSDAYVFNHIIRLLLHRGQIGELLNRREEGRTRRDCSMRLQELWRDLASFHETLPSALRFGVTSFRNMAALDKGPAFVYLHVLLQSTISLINRPSLLRRFDRDNSARAPSELAKVANHASATIASILRFAADAGQHGMEVPAELAAVNIFVDCNPFLDQLILPAGRALLAEREGAADALRRAASEAQPSLSASGESVDRVNGRSLSSARNDELVARRQYADLHLSSCQQMLDRIAKWWLGAAWPARALQQETLGASEEDDGPDGTDEEAQPAPIRDVEMVLKWAKARRLRARAELATPDRRAAESSQALRSSALHNRLKELGSEDTDMRIARLLEEAQKQQSSSSLGLGVSGSMGAESTFDIDTMINAWTRELEGIDSSAAWVPDMTSTTTPHATGHGQGSTTTISGALSRLVSAPHPMDAPAEENRMAAPTSTTEAASWPEPPSNPLGDFNLNGMQLEEFLFDPYGTAGGAQGPNRQSTPQFATDGVHGLTPSQHTLVDGQQGLMSSPHGAFSGSQSTQSQPQQQQRTHDVDGNSHLFNTFVSEQDLRTLPSALLNAFSFPPTPHFSEN